MQQDHNEPETKTPEELKAELLSGLDKAKVGYVFAGLHNEGDGVTLLNGTTQDVLLMIYSLIYHLAQDTNVDVDEVIRVLTSATIVGASK